MRRHIQVFDPSFLQTAFWAFLVICLIAFGLTIIDRVRKSIFDKAEDDILGSLKQAFEAGEIDEQEFLRVRQVLESQSMTPAKPTPSSD